MDVLGRILLCPSHDVLALGSPTRDRKYLGTKKYVTPNTKFSDTGVVYSQRKSHALPNVLYDQAWYIDDNYVVTISMPIPRPLTNTTDRVRQRHGSKIIFQHQVFWIEIHHTHTIYKVYYWYPDALIGSYWISGDVSICVLKMNIYKCENASRKIGQ